MVTLASYESSQHCVGVVIYHENKQRV